MQKYPILYRRKEECCGCGACLIVCPVKAIAMVEDNEGFEYPVIDKNKCIGCYTCVEICSFKKR